MLSKKITTQQTATKSVLPHLTNKKKRSEATFDFPGFQDEIRLHAYYNYVSRVKNNFPGDELGDWLDAEKNLSRKSSTH